MNIANVLQTAPSVKKMDSEAHEDNAKTGEQFDALMEEMFGSDEIPETNSKTASPEDAIEDIVGLPNSDIPLEEMVPERPKRQPSGIANANAFYEPYVNDAKTVEPTDAVVPAAMSAEPIPQNVLVDAGITTSPLQNNMPATQNLRNDSNPKPVKLTSLEGLPATTATGPATPNTKSDAVPVEETTVVKNSLGAQVPQQGRNEQRVHSEIRAQDNSTPSASNKTTRKPTPNITAPQTNVAATNATVEQQFQLQAQTVSQFQASDPVISAQFLAQSTAPVTTATAAVPIAQILQTTPQRIINQVSNIVANISDGNVELRLDPPELGRLIVSITQTDAGVNAHITAEKPEMADFLRRNADVFARELARSGFEGATLEFSNKDQNQGNANFENQEGASSLEINDSTVEAPTTNHVHLGGLDIRL